MTKSPAFSLSAAIESVAHKQKTTDLTSKKAKAGPPLPRTPPPSTNGKRKRTKILHKNDPTVDLTSSDDDENDITYQDDENGHVVAVPRPHKALRLISPMSSIEKDYSRDLDILRQASLSSLQDPNSIPGLLEAALRAPGFYGKRREEETARKRKAEGAVEVAFEAKRRAGGVESLGSLLESPSSPVEESVTKKAGAKRLGTPPLTQDVGNGAVSAVVESPRSPVESLQSSVEEVSPQQGFGIQQTTTTSLTQSIETVLTIDSPTSPVEEATTNRNIFTKPPLPLQPGATSTSTTPTIPTTEVSSRFMPTTHDGIIHRDPRQFSLKPPFWRAWTPNQYIAFAESLRLQFDPLPFARSSGLPVEEITSVFHAVVVNPLYFPKEAAKRGEEGMREQMELFQAKKYATPRRYWGKGTGEGREGMVFAELKGVDKGAVELVSGREGNRVVLGMRELSQEDGKYLVDNLRKEDLAVLRRDLV